MTHFTVLVATEDPDNVDTLLAPFDENLDDAPDPKWDWWVIGGRWSGSFYFKPGHEQDVIHGDRPLFGLSEDDKRELEARMNERCDGGKKVHLDLDRMRREAGEKARKRYQEYMKTIDGTPDAVPWRTYADNVSEGNGYTIAQAREEYHSQPRIKALKGTRFEDPFGTDPVEEFSVTEELYASRAVGHAIAGYALLTHEGQWVAPGDMGWFGMSSDEQPDRDHYAKVVAKYIEDLPDDMFLIMVDAHI